MTFLRLSQKRKNYLIKTINEILSGSGEPPTNKSAVADKDKDTAERQLDPKLIVFDSDGRATSSLQTVLDKAAVNY